MSTLDSALGGIAGWAALAVAAYLGAGVLATVLASQSGLPGRCATAALVLYPRIVRSTIRVTVAGTVSVGATVLSGAPAAHAGRVTHLPRPPRPPVVAPATPPAEPLDWPVATVTPAGGHPPDHDVITRRASDRSPVDVVVRPGDCLWTLAARFLGPAASARSTAAAWPLWWAANRAVIGDDPDLLLPGLRLRVPHHLERNG